MGARILAYINRMVDQELLLRNEYLVAENRILRSQLKGRLRLTDGERATLGEIAHRLGRKALEDIANVALRPFDWVQEFRLVFVFGKRSLSSLMSNAQRSDQETDH